MQKHLKQLESESIYIIREVCATLLHPVMLYSVGKDSSVMVRLAQKAFRKGKFPFPLMHIDTGYKFPEMYKFRDEFVKSIGAYLIVESAQDANIETNPDKVGRDICCKRLKTSALLSAINKYGFNVAFGGARRDEEKSRAKERIFSIRDEFGQWNPKCQRPELWKLYNGMVSERETIRVFPLSNWTEEDIWTYIKEEEIPIVENLYFARERDGVMSRYRSLGCIPCSGAIESTASNVDDIIKEVRAAKRSERENRLIDQTSESSMEQKKKEGYF